jgi:hypothetical protein
VKRAFFIAMLPTLVSLVIAFTNPIPFNGTGAPAVVLSSRSMSLDNRYGNSFVNDVFKDNILLTMSYMNGTVKAKSDINWENIEKPFDYEFTLSKGEEFAFHDQTLPNYSKNIVKMTNAHFDYADGFKSDGYLTGDGVCHLASLIYWAARDANLDTYAPTNHNFATIPDVPKEYGVAIYENRSAKEGASSNLYIINNKEKPVRFVFNYKNDSLTVSVVE